MAKTKSTSATPAKTGKAAKAPQAKGQQATVAKSKTTKPRTAKDPKKLSAITAALRVLQETGQPMSCAAMIEVMAAKGYWTSPGGKTPASTLYSAILRELQTQGNEARFVKTERGKFTLAKKR